MILVIINFVVVTKGAGRISEVTARFTLDAMPGKQMAIDADLNSGLIDETQARELIKVDGFLTAGQNAPPRPSPTSNTGASANLALTCAWGHIRIRSWSAPVRR